MISDMGKWLKPRCTTGGRTTATQAFQFCYGLTIDIEKARTWMTYADFVAIVGLLVSWGIVLRPERGQKGMILKLKSYLRARGNIHYYKVGGTVVWVEQSVDRSCWTPLQYMANSFVPFAKSWASGDIALHKR
jgi:hypothetical protein